VRVPTEQQYRRLRLLGSGALLLVPSRREWEPLLRHGWVAGVMEDNGSRFLPPLRITPAGLVALAAAVERYGLPEIGGKPQQLDEPPFIAKLRKELDEAKADRDRAQLEAQASKTLLIQVKRMLGPLEAA
jgi:hypothetical protein